MFMQILISLNVPKIKKKLFKFPQKKKKKQKTTPYAKPKINFNTLTSILLTRESMSGTINVWEISNLSDFENAVFATLFKALKVS